ncbi:MOSC domain-containing protein [Aliiroseovarius sediminis]|uniref:MOSC domain-containing protein n=1 Tax=Aliiroseovarius sediminis TaxID=2925839 RepID=UPI001F5738F9|nr:MOSC domain-containing protein [Aliiroseovarius sediminis]MCI2393802.1 MOSC domain-containing protein [Aliiroseovarius sediminis]
MTTPDLRATITGLFTGQIKQHWPGKAPSAIHKIRAGGPVSVGPLGFDGDAQADLTVHGGAEKAVHHYATDHYAFWQSKGMIPPGTQPAAFGENIATFGMDETTLCIGDILTAGTAILQISQGRQPCWKLNAHTHQDTMAAWFQKTGWTGWYYRVLQPGVITQGDQITLSDRPCPGWTVARVTQARLTRQITTDDAAQLADLPELAPGWRAAFAKMARGDRAEDTSARLGQT